MSERRRENPAALGALAFRATPKRGRPSEKGVSHAGQPGRKAVSIVMGSGSLGGSDGGAFPKHSRRSEDTGRRRCAGDANAAAGVEIVDTDKSGPWGRHHGRNGYGQALAARHPRARIWAFRNGACAGAGIREKHAERHEHVHPPRSSRRHRRSPPIGPERSGARRAGCSGRHDERHAGV